MSSAHTPHLVLLHHEKDKSYAEQLLLRLKPFARRGKLTLWSSLQLTPGEPLARVQEELGRADQVALLLSVNFMGSDELYKTCQGLKAQGKTMIPLVVGAIPDTDGEPYDGLARVEVAQIAAKENWDAAWAQATTALLQAVKPAQEPAPQGPAAPPTPVDVSSPEASQRALERMMRLLPSQFELLLFRLGVNTSLLPGGNASQAQRAMALVTLLKAKGRMAELLQALEQM